MPNNIVGAEYTEHCRSQSIRSGLFLLVNLSNWFHFLGCSLGKIRVWKNWKGSKWWQMHPLTIRNCSAPHSFSGDEHQRDCRICWFAFLYVSHFFILFFWKWLVFSPHWHFELGRATWRVVCNWRSKSPRTTDIDKSNTAKTYIFKHKHIYDLLRNSKVKYRLEGTTFGKISIPFSEF